MKGKPLYPWAVTAVVGIVLMIILSFVGLGQIPTEEAEEAAQPAQEQTANAGTDAPDIGGCVGCHGQNLEGGMGPALVGTDLPHDEIVRIINEGAAGMPGGLVSPEEAEAIATYILEQ